MTDCPLPACPVPLEWMQHGAPPEALAAFGEGFCPVHQVPLWPVMLSLGGKGSLPQRWVEAGRCDACVADWHLTDYKGQVLLTATYSITGRSQKEPSA